MGEARVRKAARGHVQYRLVSMQKEVIILDKQQEE
jgi:hypothetical protein